MTRQRAVCTRFTLCQNPNKDGEWCHRASKQATRGCFYQYEEGWQSGWITRPERVEEVHYERIFDLRGEDGRGYAFPCDKDGNVFRPNAKIGRDNLKGCLSGQFNVEDKGVQTYTNHYWKNGTFGCRCGHIIEINPMCYTNSCERCGRDYNSFGQELAPRSQWGEETGETADEIIRDCGQHVS